MMRFALPFCLRNQQANRLSPLRVQFTAMGLNEIRSKSKGESPFKRIAATISLSRQRIASNQSPYDKAIAIEEKKWRESKQYKHGGKEAVCIPLSVKTTSKDEREEKERKETPNVGS